MQEFLAFTVVGIVTGAIYAIAASGLVVTYTTSGIFNFAHGAVGMVMAFTYWELHIHNHWATIPSFIAVVFVLAPLAGAACERVLMRGLQGASVTVSLVVTLGLLVGLIGMAQSIWKPAVRIVPMFYGQGGIRIFNVQVTWQEQITLGVALLVAVALYFVLYRTRTGVAMRAVVDDRNLMSLNGGRPNLISQLSWALGFSLAGLSGVLLASILTLNILVLTLLVVNAYAAAMVGRLKSLPRTFLGALILGLIGSYTVGYVTPHLPRSVTGLGESLPTIFLFVVLLALPQDRLRVGRVIGAKTPRVPSLRQSGIGAGILVAAAWIISAPLSPANISRLGEGLALAIIMLSLVLLTGYGGQVSLCQLTFAGVGAFTMAKIGGGHSALGLLLAIIPAALVGGLIALPALRLQGLYLALATLAFGELMDNMFFANSHIFGLDGILRVGRPVIFGISFHSERAYLILLATAFGLISMFLLALRRGPFGRLLSAMKDSPVACATLGLNLTATKLAVFTISAGLAGLAGALFGGLRTAAGSSDFQVFQSLPVLLLVVIGGISCVTGALIGGMLYGFLLPLLKDRVPALAGVTYLLTGVAAVALGRNPNGLSYYISEGLAPYLWWRRSRLGDGSALTEPARPDEPVGTMAERVQVVV